MSGSTISVEHVSVSLDDVPVLDDVSVTADAGELVGLVGPNGSGKTTLLRTISGALTPDSGRVRVDGEDIHALPSKAASQRVAVVPQDTSISFSFDVRRIVGMGRTAHRGRFERTTADDRAAIEAAMERTATRQFAERPIDTISGGERQRVLLARAIAQETPALLLDEPTASLDVNHAIETLQSVRSLVADGRAAVAAIHDLDLAARFCDSLVLLSSGDVVATGSPEAVLTESTVSSTFDVRSAVTPDPVTGATTVRALEDRARPVGERVHVLGTGRSASRTLAVLDRAGFDLSLGPVPAGDIAAATADSLGGDTVHTTPLSSPTDDQIRTACERARSASVVVLADPDSSVDETVVQSVLADVGPVVLVRSETDTERSLPEYCDRLVAPSEVDGAVIDLLADPDPAEVDRRPPGPTGSDADVPPDG